MEIEKITFTGTIRKVEASDTGHALAAFEKMIIKMSLPEYINAKVADSFTGYVTSVMSEDKVNYNVECEFTKD